MEEQNGQNPQNQQNMMPGMQQMPKQESVSSQASLGGIFGGAVGGAGAMQQVQRESTAEGRPFNIMDPMSMMNPMNSGQASAEQMKDYRLYQQSMVNSCAQLCLKRERNFHKDSELCQAKCYDLAIIYSRVGLNEINQFSYENNIRT